MDSIALNKDIKYGKQRRRKLNKFSKMEEEPTSTRFLIPLIDYENIFTTMPHILKHILLNLEIRDLLRCKLVCSLWEYIVNVIMGGKFYIISQEFKLRDIKNAIEQPEIMLRCLKLPRKTDVQLIMEFSNNLSTICHLCVDDRRCASIFRGIDHLSNSDGIYFGYTADSESLVDVAIFPTLPGVQMLRFSISSMEVKGIVRCGVSSVAEKLKLPKEDLKCVIWYSSDRIQELFTKNQDYAFAGVSDIHLKEGMNIGIAFHGNRMKAVSMNVYKTLLPNEDYEIYPPFSENQIQALKKYKIDQNKCIAFVFSSYQKQCCKNHTLLPFRQSFPDVPIIYYSCSEHFGNDFLPGLLPNVPEGNKSYSVSTLVLVWYD